MSVQIPAAMSLPARYYIDPELLSSGARLVFLRDVDPRGTGRRDSRSGRFRCPRDRRREPDRRPDEQGELACVLQRLPPPGHPVDRGRSGRFASTIQCPYHAWTYDLGGCLVAAPQMDRCRRFPPGRLPAPAGRRRHLGRPYVSQPGREPGAAQQQLDGLDERFRPWGWNSFAPASESSTTSRPTGS